MGARRLTIFLFFLLSLTAVRAQQATQSSPPAGTDMPTTTTSPTPAEPSAEMKACIDRLGDFAKKSPLFIQALCNNENGIIPGSTTTTMMPPLLPEDGFQGPIFDSTG